ncbi:MAG: DUF2339 domain-containing protein [Candidatus Sumerlaeaceae bacterium]|nr:DUF2339 domain-containing protein [Candidatus Sumerlaeaceae bacterium]
MPQDPLRDEEIRRLSAELEALRDRVAALELQAGIASPETHVPRPINEIRESARERAQRLSSVLSESLETDSLSEGAAQAEESVPDRQVTVETTRSSESKPVSFPSESLEPSAELSSALSMSPVPESFELRVAKKLFLYIGVAALAVAFFFAALEYSIGPWPKVMIGYAVSVAVMGFGLWRERVYPKWGQPLVGAGLALSYFTTYAAGFISATRVIPDLNAALVALGFNVVAMFAVAQWRRSEATAGMALLLGYFTAAISQSSAHALWSLGALSAGAVIFMWLNRWFYASLLAVVAAYAGHFYAWKFMPEPPGRETAEVFRVNAMFLTTYFAVFALGSLASLRQLTGQPAEDGPQDSASAHLLALVTRLNTGFYAAAMVLLLGVTEIYWTKSCYFFFALSAVTALLSTFYGALPAVRDFYIVAASLLFGFGLVSSLTSAWLPIALTVQAVGMLVASQRVPGRAMVLTSVAAFTYAAVHLVLTSIYPGMTLGFVPTVRPEWWTVVGAVTAQLVYIGLWTRHPAAKSDEEPVAEHLFGLTAALSLTMSLDHVASDSNATLRAVAMAAPVVAVIGARFTIPGFMTFVAAAVVAYLGAIGNITGRKGLLPGLADDPLWIMGLAGLVAGYSVERLAVQVMRSRTWAVVSLYLGASISLSLLMRDCQQSFLMMGLAVQSLLLSGVALALGSGWLMGASLLPAGICVAVGNSILFDLSLSNVVQIHVLLASVALTAASFVIGSLPRRVGAPRGELRHWSAVEVLLLFATGFFVDLWAQAWWPEAPFMPLSVYPLILMLGAVLLRRQAVVYLSLLYVLVVLDDFDIVERLLGDVGGGDPAAQMRRAWFSVVTTLIVVLMERVFAKRRHLALVDRTNADDFVPFWTARFVDIVLPALTVIMLILSGRLHPSVRDHLFTAAVVLAGFLWVGLGLAFGSRSYRLAGFGVICFAIFKAFLYDVRNLENIYRIVLFMTLGAILIIVPYLYSRFRGRLRS